MVRGKAKTGLNMKLILQKHSIKQRGDWALSKRAYSRRVVVISFIALVFFQWIQAIGSDFNAQIRPILSDHCFQCHGPDGNRRKADLRLDTKEGLFGVLPSTNSEKSSIHAPVTPGSLKESLIWERILSDDPEEQMPPPDANKALTPSQIESIKKWIESGAPYETHWAFIPPTLPEVPDFSQDPTWKSWTRNPLDAFVLRKMLEEGLTPEPEAPLNLLIRRSSLDILGLPPEPAAFDKYLNRTDDKTRPPGALYEEWIQEALASPHYGERMVWPWLDAARYADSNGYQADRERTMWPWRDWAAKAFNENLPFDQFTVWQIAGDLIPEDSFPENNRSTRMFEAQLATGFLRNHMINGEGGRIAEENRVDYVLDMTETVGTVWMGLTVGCSRCHDHKFDPITQMDYYALSGFFNQTPVNGGGGDPQTAPILPVPSIEQNQRSKDLKSQIQQMSLKLDQYEANWSDLVGGLTELKSPPENIGKILEQPTERRNQNQLSELSEFFKESAPNYAKDLGHLASIKKELDNLNGSVPKVMIMGEQKDRRDTFVLNRGLYNQPGDKVTAATPGFLTKIGKQQDSQVNQDQTESRNRLDLANWLVDRNNPLTARVVVNRFWQMFFGYGLCRTPEDFGSQGKPPTHPELLDWLSVEFQDRGWDVKWLVQTIVTSSTYRQSARISPEKLEKDPENLYLSRSPRYRLPSWMIRDQALAAAGILNPAVGGSPVFPYQPEGVWADATFGNKRYRESTGSDLYRRSLYTFWRRIVGPTQFFDAAKRQVCEVKPTRTNSPLHALQTLNDPAYIEAARLMGESLNRTATDSERLEELYKRLLTRDPQEQELEVLLKALERLRNSYSKEPEAAKALVAVGASDPDPAWDAVESAAWTALISMVLNLDETISKP